MDELVEFLLACFAEDEAAARAATPGPWTPNNADPAYVIGAVSDDGEEYLDVADAAGSGRPGGWKEAEADAAHIARHDPARVLAECEAKRRIVTEIVPRIDRLQDAVDREWGANDDHATEGLLCLLALPYADRPDYRQEWRP